MTPYVRSTVATVAEHTPYYALEGYFCSAVLQNKLHKIESMDDLFKPSCPMGMPLQRAARPSFYYVTTNLYRALRKSYEKLGICAKLLTLWSRMAQNIS